MRIGPKERDILLRLTPGEFVPPSVYLGDYRSCPTSAHTLQRLKQKGLVVMRYQTWTPEDFLRQRKLTTPGRETFEVNAAMLLTEEGKKVRKYILDRNAAIQKYPLTL